MQPSNLPARRKRLLTFAGLYAASLILLFFIFSAFGVHFSVSEKAKTPAPAQSTATYADDAEILHTDSLLHGSLRHLQGLDDQYTLLLADSGNTVKRKGIQDNIKMSETDFAAAIDNADKMSEKFSGDKGVMFRTLVNSFKSIADSRKDVKDIQTSIASGTTVLSEGQLDMLKWKNEMQLKDNELARLQIQIKALASRELTPSRAVAGSEAQKSENEVLKTAFDDQLRELEALKVRYDKLKTDNGTLAAQMVEMKKASTAVIESSNNNNAAGTAAAETKINSLQQKVQDLNADVSFAKIDCNLARVDAQQLISNARQRKELLSESLQLLNNLSASADASIQKKAKEKISRLNRIATTLHD